MPRTKYLGCYRDKRNSRAFPNKAVFKNFTLDECLNFALNPTVHKPHKPAKYFGLEFGESPAIWLAVAASAWLL